MRVLITGASGFVGGRLAETLLEQGDAIVGISAHGRWPVELAHLKDNVRLEAFDLAAASPEEAAELITRKKPEVVYHLAAQSNPQASVEKPVETWKINLGGCSTCWKG